MARRGALLPCALVVAAADGIAQAPVWGRTKTDLGLAKPKARNEGDIKTNLKAGIVLLARKGFGKSGQAPKPAGTFDGWQVALQR